jgi:hypothetical protein
MRRQRRICAVGLAVAVGAFNLQALDACGDKFLRAGRSARTRGYAAMNPATILIYKPNASPKGLRALETLLKHAGHKAVAVKPDTELPTALNAARYDIVIADYSDRALVTEQLRVSAARANLLPILYKTTAQEDAEAAAQFHCLLRIDKMTKYEALDEIDHLMDLRRKTASGQAK